MEDRIQRTGPATPSGPKIPGDTHIRTHCDRVFESRTQGMRSPSSGHTSLGPYRWQLAVIVCAVVGVAIFSAVVLLGSSSGGGPPQACACPAGWGVGHGPGVTPGSVGCQDLPGESCFSGVLVSYLPGVQLSGLRFEVLGPPWNSSNVLNSTPVSLGDSARVTVLAPDNTVVGAWDWSTTSWSQGSGWVIPTGANVTLILDTGFQNAKLSGDWFETFMVNPNYGSVGIRI